MNELREIESILEDLLKRVRNLIEREQIPHTANWLNYMEQTGEMELASYLPIQRNFRDWTINDLMNSSPEMLSRYRGIGPKKIEKIIEWMNLNGLEFIHNHP